MKTNTTKQTEGRARVQSEQFSTMSCRVWDVVLDGQVIGSVHGATEAEARDRVAPFKLNLRIVPHPSANQ